MRPAGWFIAADPYAVQAEAWRLSRDKPRFGLWLEQGLGKTQLDLATFLHALYEDTVAAHLIVAPSYLASGWRDEVVKWSVDVPVFTWPERIPERALRDPHIFITYPEACISSGGDYVDDLLQSRPYAYTIDESSMIKSHTGKWSKRLMNWREYAPVCRSLSGTPMSQDVLDLWAQLRFCGAIQGWNPYAFRNHFGVSGGFMGKQIVGFKNEEELHSLMDGHVFRALKADWWDDMPEKIYPAPLEFEMTKKQLQLYDEMRSDFIVQLADRDVTADQTVHAMLKLTQIGRGFIIDGEGTPHDLMPAKDNPSLRAARAAVDMAGGKVIVFALYRHSCDLLLEVLRDFHPAVLRGQMEQGEIASEKARFNGDPECRVIVCQEHVGARGHTLLGGEGKDRCSTTLFYENSYSLELRSQSEDRNHRFGQDKAVVYLDLAGSPQDVAVIHSLQKKQSVVEAVVNSIRAVPI